MEPVSTAASLLAVLEATTAVCKSITVLYRNVREAPKELAHLCTQISQTQVRLNIQIRLHENLKNSNIGTLIPDEALQTLETDLKNAEHAISSGSYELVNFLLHSGASPDELKTQCHMSPLQEACIYGHIDIARLLLAKGAFLEHSDSVGRTAFTMLWFQPSRPFCRTMFLRALLAYSPLPSVFEPSRGPRPLACAALEGQAKDLELLKDSGVYANVEGQPGDRIINHSIAGPNLATFDFLAPLTPREWISEVDHLGRGPLHRALEYPSSCVKGILKRLLEMGADVHLRDFHGNDPGDVARICDIKAANDWLWGPKYPGNTRAYFKVLVSSGFDVHIDEDDTLWWSSEDTQNLPAGGRPGTIPVD
ncbi:MAG: hypothetical protein Q9180_004148 [Flavoplaca navasiana]